MNLTSEDILLKKLGARLRERDFDERMANAIAARILEEKPNAKAKVLRFGRTQKLAAGLALAAGFALFISTRAPSESLPAYDVTVVGAKTHRAAEEVAHSADVTLDPRGDFDLVARPKTPARNVVVRAQLFRDGKELPWSPPIEVSADGAIRIASTTRALFPETRGSYDVVLLVGQKTLRTRVHFAE